MLRIVSRSKISRGPVNSARGSDAVPGPVGGVALDEVRVGRVGLGAFVEEARLAVRRIRARVLGPPRGH